MAESLIEKLQIKDEKNLLIQGLPSTIEKQFSKLFFSKNVTPLLKSRKIDFALIFAVNENQLNVILTDVLPSLSEDAKFWVAYPKTTSKIASNLNRDCSWTMITANGFEPVRSISLDHVWSALRFKKTEDIPARNKKEVVETSQVTGRANGIDKTTKTIELPDYLTKELTKNKTAGNFFNKLSFTNKKEYVTWITGAKKEETRQKRIHSALKKLEEGKKNPSEK